MNYHRRPRVTLTAIIIYATFIVCAAVLAVMVTDAAISILVLI